ncbi:MAG: tRNA 2-thiouridine(34) synthase MnmA [Cystobacterineae bacterium]|nr:tRNA 2-thiouridine(34) synthase MnmA [Cystobacterineae bacterium]
MSWEASGARQGPRIVVAMSGGVDSSVAAALLQKEGLQPIGVTLKLQECHEAKESRSCCGVDGIARARAVAGQLGIAHYVVDCTRAFELEVLRPAWEEYSAGRTPSPCLLCNEHIKFGLLLSWAQRLGIPQVATGHYARVEHSLKGEPALFRGVDGEKDQSYFLAGLSKAQLSAVLFPLGHLEKAAVRALGCAMGLSTAKVRDSQDACLVSAENSFADMLRERFCAVGRAGPIVDEANKPLGQHRGLHNFTVGQRRGLEVPSSKRLWVKALRNEDAALIVTDREEALLSHRFVATGMNWLVEPAPGSVCEVQVRSRHAAVQATLLKREGSCVTVELHHPVRAVTPGQAAVFYAQSRVLGRGWIHLP